MAIQDGAQLLEVMRGYQVPCILAAAVDLDLLEKLVCRAADGGGSGCCRTLRFARDDDRTRRAGGRRRDRQTRTSGILSRRHSPVLMEASGQSVTGHVASSGELPAALVAIALDGARGSAGFSRAEHSRRGGRSGFVHRGDACHLARHRRPADSGNPSWRRALRAGSGRRIRIVDPGLAEGRAGCTRDHLRSAARDSDGPRTTCGHALC